MKEHNSEKRNSFSSETYSSLNMRTLCGVEYIQANKIQEDNATIYDLETWIDVKSHLLLVLKPSKTAERPHKSLLVH